MCLLGCYPVHAPDRDGLTGQKPDTPDQGIAIRQVYPVLPLKGVALPVKAIHSSRLRQNNETGKYHVLSMHPV